MVPRNVIAKINLYLDPAPVPDTYDMSRTSCECIINNVERQPLSR